MGPKLFALLEGIGEFRYPVSFRFLDHRGAIAEALANSFELALDRPTDEEIRMLDSEGVPRLVMGPSSTWFSLAASPGESLEQGPFGELATHLDEILESHLQVELVSRVGFRCFSIVAWQTVTDAVAAFRRDFFDYREDKAACLGGTPKEVQVMVRSGGVAEVSGGPEADAVLRATPLHMVPQLAESLAVSPEEWGGAWGVDLDVYVEQPTTQPGSALADLYVISGEILDRLAKDAKDSANVASA